MTLQYQLAYTKQGALLFLIAAVVVVFAILLYRSLSHRRMERIGTILLSIGTISLYFSVLLGYRDYDKSMILYAMSLLFLVIGYLYNLLIKKHYSRKTSLQILCLSVVIFIWYFSAVYSPISIKEYPSLIIIGCFANIIGLVFWIWQSISSITSILNNSPRTNSLISLFINGFMQNKWLILVLFLFIILSIDTFCVIPMWDSSFYLETILSACRWNFSPGTIQKLDLFGHKSGAYTVFMEIGAWLFSDAVFGIHMIQLLMALLTIVSFKKIIDKVLIKSDNFEKVLSTALFAFSPALLGMLPNISLDYPMLLFLTWLLCCYFHEWKILQVACGILLCFTKEPAVFAYAGFVVGVYLIRLFKCNNQLPKKIFSCLKFQEYVQLAFPAVTWLAAFLLTKPIEGLQGDWDSSEMSFLKWGGKITDLSSRWDGFGYAPDYISGQIEHAFLANFMWILLVILLAGFIYYIFSHKFTKSTAPCGLKDTVILCISILVFYTFILCFFITHSHYRYTIPTVTVILLLFIILTYKLFDKAVLRKCILFTVMTLFLIQSFVNIDPVTKRIGKQVSVGAGTVANFDLGMAEGMLFSDSSLHNRQGADWSVLIQSAMEIMECDENTLILIPEMQNEALYQIFGLFGQRAGYGIYWNPVTNTFSTLKSEGYIRIQYGELQNDGAIMGTDISNTMVSIDPKDYDTIYFINAPFCDEIFSDSCISNAEMAISYSKRLQYRTCSLKIMKLTN